MRASGDEEALLEFEEWLYTPPEGSGESSAEIEQKVRDREMRLFANAQKQQGNV